HAAIARWRYEQQIARTRKRRPDLYQAWLDEKERERGSEGEGE
ncbi:MAG: tRNA (guanosine(37)-N1)-methyltransferase TrmD, partial [Cyanobacteria bacterium J06648_1]